ncbi:MAG TPA: acyltransferase family protein [Candidatus Dormibacteraeota bacterium]|nr:acyltransferase family protein [Candidatus Dormibacteraeota bacterium]
MESERIHYLDWLKVVIVYGILLFHVSLVFTTADWLISNHDRSRLLSAFAGFCFPWGIPAMFLISGADAWFGLRSTPPRAFVWRRVVRLLLPMVVGLIVISPYQRFVSSHNPPPPLSQLPQFYLSFYRSFHFEASLQWVSRYWLHLWFLGYLFAISVVCLPLFVWLKGEIGRSFTGELVRVANFRGGLFVIAAPLFLAQLILRPLFPGYQDWADVSTYLFVFAMGAIFFSDRRFEPSIVRDIRWIVAVGILAVLGAALILQSVGYNLNAIPHLPMPEGAAFALFWALDVWTWNLAVLYVGIRWFNWTNRFLTYGQESILPFYVIHHPVVLTIASFVVTWNVGLWPKFAIILVLGYAITLSLYEVGVRRWRLMRTMFGLGPPRPRVEPQPALSRA